MEKTVRLSNGYLMECTIVPNGTPTPTANRITIKNTRGKITRQWFPVWEENVDDSFETILQDQEQKIAAKDRARQRDADERAWDRKTRRAESGYAD